MRPIIISTPHTHNGDISPCSSPRTLILDPAACLAFAVGAVFGGTVVGVGDSKLFFFVSKARHAVGKSNVVDVNVILVASLSSLPLPNSSSAKAPTSSSTVGTKLVKFPMMRSLLAGGGWAALQCRSTLWSRLTLTARDGRLKNTPTPPVATSPS